MSHYLSLFLKGVAMGAANVIPGVSGGTIAFVTGIYEQFINALKSIDHKAAGHLFALRFAAFSRHVNLPFLAVLFLGVALSLVTLGKLFDWLFIHYPTYTWSYFFGLILASVYYVSKSIRQWNPPSVLALLAGVAAALVLAFLKPAEENPSFLYVSLCGVVAVCSMILPGLSGSFVLILMGNYQLVMLRAVPHFDLGIILPFAVGGAVGFVALSHLIAFLLKRFHDATLSLLTGFILGSLVIIWPWKDQIHLRDDSGAIVLKKGEPIVQGYQWHWPDLAQHPTWIGVALIMAGIVSVALIEREAVARQPLA